jgi:K+-transporting ATPase ATPase C chain
MNAPLPTTAIGSQPEQRAANSGSILHHIYASCAATVILLAICCAAYPALIWAIAQGIFPHEANGSLLDRQGKPTNDPSKAVASELLAQNFSVPGYFHPRPSAAGNGYDPTSSGGSNYGPISDKLLNGATSQPATQPAPADASTQPATAPAATTAPATAPTTAPTTQPETLAYDGLRLRVIHYAVDNNIAFKLTSQRADGTGPAVDVPLSKYTDSSGNLNDVALVDAFPHPATDGATPDRMVLIATGFSRAVPVDAVTASASGLDPHISRANADLQAPRVAAARNISVDVVEKLIDQATDPASLGFIGESGVNIMRLNLALDAAAPIPAPTTAPTSAPAPAPATKP